MDVTLAWILLASGHDVELTGLEVFSTYGGMLEGYPCALVNDRLLAGLAKRRESAYRSPPVHVIDPPRRYPKRESGEGPGTSRSPFGPVEILPAVYCRGDFRGGPIDEELDGVLYESYLTVVWFQEDLALPVAEFVTAAVSELAWDRLAEDRER